MIPDPQEISSLLRQRDPDRYLSILYAPENKRMALSILYAFDLEISSIRDRVSQPLTGEIRLQWWRDTLADSTTAETGNPIADGLKKVIADHQLPLIAFQNMLEARIFDLYDDPMPTRNDLEGYCGETMAALTQLAAFVLDREKAGHISDLAGHAGCALLLTRLLLLFPIHRRRGQCYIPLDILAAVGARPEDLFSDKNQSGAQNAVLALVALAREHHQKFMRDLKHLPPSLRPAFLPVFLVPAYLQKIEAMGLAIFDHMVAIPAMRRHWLMFRSAILAS